MPLKDKAEYNAYLNTYMKNRWTIRRQEAVDYLGGACVACGGTENLDFHHKDKSTKSFSIGRASSYSDKRFYAEVDKCELRCKVCHVIEHYGLPKGLVYE